MIGPSGRDRIVHYALAALLLLPLLLAFAGSGGFSDAYGTYQTSDPAALAARRWALAAATGRSLLIGVLATLLGLALGIPAGWFLAQRGGGRSARSPCLLALAALPLALPPSVAVSGWIGLLAPAGAASRFNAPILGFAPETRGWLFSSAGAAFVLGLSLWPIVAFEAWPAFRRVRFSEAYDAALLYGSRSRCFWRVVLPQSKGELAAGALLAFLLASSDFCVSSLLMVRTLPIEIHDALTVGKTAAAAWAALPLLIMVLAIAAVLHCGAAVPAACRRDACTTSARSSPVACVFLVAGVLLGFALPMCVCLLQTLTGGRPMSTVFGAGSDALLTSVRLAGAATLLAVFVAVLRAVLWPQARVQPLNTAGLFLLAVPGSFLAAALLTAQLQLTQCMPVQTFAAIIPPLILTLGYLARFIYVPLRLVEEGLAALDPDLFDAAALAGQNRLARGISIALPLVVPHIAAAAALVFVLSLGEVAIADKLHPPGVTPATVWLFQQQHLGYDEAVFGLSLLLGAVVAAVLLAAGITMSVLSVRLGRTQAPNRIGG
ncbi:MAG: hypothetical protein NTW87_22480 [Planctomycetota bacterium]|nr:hypothetical protein [Planctomycetota bacterium]